MAVQEFENLDLEQVNDTQKIQILKKINTDLKSSLDDIISILTKFSEAISIKFDLKNLLELVCDTLKDIIKYSSIAITIYDGEKDSFNYMALRNVEPAIDAKIKNIIGDGLAHWSISQKRSIVLPDMENNAEATVLIVPLITQMETVGVIFMYCKKTAESFMQQDLEFLNILGAQSAIAIKNTFLYNEMGLKNQDLADLKNYLNDVINNMVTGIIVLDMQGVIKTFNHVAENLICVSANATIGKVYNEILPLSISEKLKEAFTEAAAADLQHTKPFNELEVDYSETGKIIPIRISYNCIKDSNSKIFAIIFMLRDMSESREIQRLREIDKIKSELVANVSHELRTPLTSIKAYSETLIDIVGSEDVDTQKEFLNIICQESERLTNLISNLLDLSKLEAGDFKLVLSSVNLSEIVKKCALLVKELAGQKGVSISVEIPQQASNISCDASKIEQVIINLLSNAIKYNKPEGGKVDVSLKENKSNFEIVIKDTGIGMPKEALGKIFEKFFRVDSSLTYQVSGTGLGLAIVKHIIEKHNGQITVESAINAGSKFTVTLPKK
ncbi:MAG TPA: ATP-binding protein [Candidatus Wallbacteria bacterium]|nr:ATP-binding protein [Candidatus Wallbacteria bacterium]